MKTQIQAEILPSESFFSWSLEEKELLATVWVRFSRNESEKQPIGSITLLPTGSTEGEEIWFSCFDLTDRAFVQSHFDFFMGPSISNGCLWAVPPVKMWNTFSGYMKHSILCGRLSVLPVFTCFLIFLDWMLLLEGDRCFISRLVNVWRPENQRKKTMNSLSVRTKRCVKSSWKWLLLHCDVREWRVVPPGNN